LHQLHVSYAHDTVIKLTTSIESGDATCSFWTDQWCDCLCT